MNMLKEMTSNKQFTQVQLLTKGVLALSIGIFCVLVGTGNILDFNSNWQFVQHVLSMDSMEPWFSSQTLQERSINNELIQVAFYVSIICGELLSGVFCSLGGGCILRSMFHQTNEHLVLRGKILFTLGSLVAILVWYAGFAVIGGEYFAMWANKWNGQMKAYAFIGFILLSLVYVSQPEHIAE